MVPEGLWDLWSGGKGGAGWWLLAVPGGKHRRATVVMARRLCNRCLVSEVVERDCLFTGGRGFWGWSGSGGIGLREVCCCVLRIEGGLAGVDGGRSSPTVNLTMSGVPLRPGVWVGS